MGDLGEDTAVEPVGDGCYRGTIREAWRAWGPFGGYVASLALRAVGAESSFDRPVSFSCHYLSAGAFEDVDIAVTTLRRGRSAESFRVSMTQGDRAVLEAIAWTGRDDGDAGYEHDDGVAPDVAGPDGVPSMRERFAAMGELDVLNAFWDNIEARPPEWHDEWPPPGPIPGHFTEWYRFEPTAVFEDPWVDACRTLMVADLVGWPSAQIVHAWHGEPLPYLAPNLDLYVAFHRRDPASAWLLGEGTSLVSHGGTVGAHGHVWAEDRRLLATCATQLLWRPVPDAAG